MIPGTNLVGGAAAAGGSGSAAQAMGGLDSDAFLQLMVAQLKYQNPMSPSDPAAMLQQTAQFTQVETMQQILTTQQQLMGLQEVVLATSFVGREVSVDTTTGPVTGTVSGVRFSEGGPLLTVGGNEYPLSQTTTISAARHPAPSAAEPAQPQPAPTSPPPTTTASPPVAAPSTPEV